MRSVRLSLLLALTVLAVACHSHPRPEVWKLAFITDPTPPQAGAVTRFRCLLTTASGAPLDGAAAFIQLAPRGAAVPAATPLHVQLVPRGNGVYEGELAIPSPGAWTATLTLSRQGRTQLRRYPFQVKPSPLDKSPAGD